MHPWLHLRCLFRRQQYQLFSTCHASASSKHLFPFPHGANPTPHEIFHLPRSASQQEIKARYYELVKVYHPDATHGQHDMSPSVRNTRFRAITHAYGVLRGRQGPTLNRSSAAWNDYAARDEAIRAELRRRSRRASAPSPTTTTAGSNVSDAPVWYSLVAFVLAGMIAAMGSASAHMDRVERHTQSAAANLAQARTEAQVYGVERRRKIRERVRAFQDAEEGATVEGAGDHPEMRQRSKAWLAELSRGETRPVTSSNDRV